ncbi:DUF2169 domain-containing protein [Halomonas campisalis]|uniref:DUF2169 domain-containing protein n=1 Tax=Billgrantia campisalis TaxID=74661 RepID=A0ABS9P6T7_9GAMM|nr:DUF2169 domain-containing protein [Halomonas campisalis]MCG6657500.1 DUF2169 domain-containing protein [Halomonas campisalis]MDR5863153.1 DUF2169 domain-containing protein [Halomonas campisalis]
MELINATPMQAGYTQGLEPSGREHLVVVVKGTFEFPRSEVGVRLAEEQLPLVTADTFTGEPGFSAPVFETDYVPWKPRCDVLLHGTAHAPGGRPAARVPVGLQVAGMAKEFLVVGERRWQAGLIAISPGPPQMFTRQPVTYDQAFGGLDDFHPDESRHSAYMANPVGKGYHRKLKGGYIDGTPMPSTEELDRPVKMPNRDYRPMAFGPLGRGWQPRLGYAGTYDQRWLDEEFPFLPQDFQDAYYQAAPADQQITFPRGGEPVQLLNLTPEGRTLFHLPQVEVPVVFFRKSGERHETLAVLDTIFLLPDAGLFTLSWRASLPLRRNLFEIPQVLVGRMSRGWWRARELGKEYHASLASVVRAKRSGEPGDEP